MRTRVKICGITRPDDAAAAVEAGADAVGLVFCERSPRNVSLDVAREIATRVPAFVTITALFVDAPVAQVEDVIRALGAPLLQFHGDEAPADCRRYGLRYVKALAMGTIDDPTAEMARYPDASGFVLDSHAVGALGGSGHAFDWRRAQGLEARIILAGGLGPDNVAAAIATARPWAVDVSSGVERAPGVKSHLQIQQFVAAVQHADRAGAPDATNGE